MKRYRTICLKNGFSLFWGRFTLNKPVTPLLYMKTSRNLSCLARNKERIYSECVDANELFVPFYLFLFFFVRLFIFDYMSWFTLTLRLFLRSSSACQDNPRRSNRQGCHRMYGIVRCWPKNCRIARIAGLEFLLTSLLQYDGSHTVALILLLLGPIFETVLVRTLLLPANNFTSLTPFLSHILIQFRFRCRLIHPPEHRITMPLYLYTTTTNQFKIGIKKPSNRARKKIKISFYLVVTTQRPNSNYKFN